MTRTVLVCIAALSVSYPAEAQWVRAIDNLAQWAGSIDPDSMCTSGLAVDPGRGYLYVYGYARGSTFQLYRSADGGGTWTTCANAHDAFAGWGTSGGTMGFSFNMDPQTGHMACFITHGMSAMTVDNGDTWAQIQSTWMGFDHGDVDWNSPDPRVLYMNEHNTADLYLCTDSGWYRATRLVDTAHTSSTNCLGVMDSMALVRGGTDGIYRSPDLGNSWSKVADHVVYGKSPVRYGSRFYWTSSQGVIVTEDKGLTWRLLSSLPGPVWGPYFGTSEREMVTVNSAGVQKSDDGGLTWTHIIGYVPQTSFSTSASGLSFGWDPIRDIYFCAVIGGGLYKYQPATVTAPGRNTVAVNRPATRPIHCNIRGQALGMAVAPGVYLSESGVRVVGRHCLAWVAAEQ